MINGKEVKTLIDSGAAANIITNKLRKRLGIRIERPSKTIFTIANGKKIPSLGETEITIEIDEEIEIPITVQVIDSVKEDLLLGTAFLVKTKGVIDFENGKLTLKYDGEQIEIPIYYIKGESENESSESEWKESEKSEEEESGEDEYDQYEEIEDESEIYSTGVTIYLAELNGENKCEQNEETEEEIENLFGE